MVNRMTKTEQDLLSAFAGESQANRKYLAFADTAKKEGFPQIAKLFRAAAAAESVHANNHYRAVGGIRSTVDNLKTAIAGEYNEFTKMYPEMLAHAKEDNNNAATRTFYSANEVEKIHHKLYSTALAAVEKQVDLPKQDIYVCPVCGFTVEGKAPDECPICKAKGSTFMRIE